MHQALYRKYRPRSFDDVSGQDHITSVLRYEVMGGTPSHAYLFCGSRGTGKTTCAKILAKAVNCEAPENGSPCCKCAACRAIDSGSATDVLEMDAASNNGVENIRDIRDEVVYTPSSLKYRVYIVDEVHMLSTSAFNALLKTLEEPPAHVIFILATTELHKLPATIISRCQRFDFRRISTAALAARLAFIAAKESITLENAAAERIARLAQGGMRDAISLLELCAGGGRSVDVATVNEMMGSVGRESSFSLVRAILQADYDAVFAAVQDAVSAARDLSVFWQDLIGVYRDILVMKTTDNATQYLDLAEGEAAELASLAAGFTRGTLLAHCRLLEEALLSMKEANAVKRMVAELTLVRLCDKRLDTTPEGLLARIEKLEEGAALMPAAAKVAPAPIAEKSPAPSVEAKAAPKPVSAAAPKAAAPATVAVDAAPSAGQALTRMRGYANCLERIARTNSMIASFLKDSRAYIDGTGRVLVVLPNSFAEMMLVKANGRDVLRHALCLELQREVSDGQLQIQTRSEAVVPQDTDLDDILNAANEP